MCLIVRVAYVSIGIPLSAAMVQSLQGNVAYQPVQGRPIGFVDLCDYVNKTSSLITYWISRLQCLKAGSRHHFGIPETFTEWASSKRSPHPKPFYSSPSNQKKMYVIYIYTYMCVCMVYGDQTIHKNVHVHLHIYMYHDVLLAT